MGARHVVTARMACLLEGVACRQAVGAHDAWKLESCLFATQKKIEKAASRSDRAVLPAEGGCGGGNMPGRGGVDSQV